MRLIGFYFPFFISVVPTLVTGSSVSENRIVATAFEENLKLSCILPSSLPGFRHLAWIFCADLELHVCLSSVEKVHPIAGIVNKTSIRVYFPQIFEIDLNGTLKIVRVLPDYDGKAFICRAHFHSIGKRWKITQLEIQERPRIEIKMPEDIYVPKGTNLFLVCMAVGWPPPQLTWTRGNDLLLTSTVGTYVQQNVIVEDSGMYTCIAKNAFGFDSRTMKVIVFDDVREPDCPSKPPSDLSCSTSTCTIPTDNPGDQECDTYKVTTYVFPTLLLLAVGYIIFLKRKTLLSFVTCTYNAQVINERNINLHV